MKTSKTTITTNHETQTVPTAVEPTVKADPFAALMAGQQSGDAATQSRKLDLTPVLTATAMQRALETIQTAAAREDLHALANQMMDGDPAVLLSLFDATGISAHVADDAAALAGADEDQLKRLLESRRSDRSKCKHKGIKTNIATCRAYVAAMYAELMVREAMGKPYTGAVGATASDVDTDDLDAVNRRIKSLQSKKCRLGKLVQAGDETQRPEYEATVAEIERLQAFRPTTTKTVVKSVKVDELRAALALLKADEVPEEVRALMEKIG